MSDNLEFLYEQKRKRQAEDYQKSQQRDKKERMKKKGERKVEIDDDDTRLNTMELAGRRERSRDLDKRSRKGRDGPQTGEEILEEKEEKKKGELKNRMLRKDLELEEEDLGRSRWFDRDIFNVVATDPNKMEEEAQDSEIDENLTENTKNQKSEESSEEEEQENEQMVDDFGPDFDETLDYKRGMEEDMEAELELGSNPKSAIKLKQLKAIKERRKILIKQKMKEAEEEDEELRPEEVEKLQNIEEGEEDPFKDHEYDGRYDIKLGLTDMQKRKKVLKKSAKRKEKEKEKDGRGTKIKIVPAKRFEDYKQDELAQDLAMAKKMLRKKDREDIMDMAVNRYNYMDDPEDLPDWFIEDEKRHTGIILPVTKEEMQEERQRIRVLNEMPSKKVMEAKFRQKKRLIRQMKKFKQKAEEVFDTDGLDARTKLRQVGMLRNTIIKKKNSQKRMVVAKTGTVSAPGRKTQGRKYKMVDNRLKNDLKSKKRADKRKKSSIGSKRISKVNSAKKYSRKRRK